MYQMIFKVHQVNSDIVKCQSTLSSRFPIKNVVFEGFMNVKQKQVAYLTGLH